MGPQAHYFGNGGAGFGRPKEGIPKNARRVVGNGDCQGKRVILKCMRFGFVRAGTIFHSIWDLLHFPLELMLLSVSKKII